MQRSRGHYTFNKLLDVNRVVYEIAHFVGNLADITVLRLIAKNFHIFDTMGKQMAKKRFLSRLALYFGTEDLANLFCKTFLSNFDYCFSGSTVLAAIFYGKEGIERWDKDTSIFIAGRHDSVYT